MDDGHPGIHQFRNVSLVARKSRQPLVTPAALRANVTNEGGERRHSSAQERHGLWLLHGFNTI